MCFLSEWVDVTNDWWRRQIDATTSQKRRIMRGVKRRRRRNQREKNWREMGWRAAAVGGPAQRVHPLSEWTAKLVTEAMQISSPWGWHGRITPRETGGESCRTRAPPLPALCDLLANTQFNRRELRKSHQAGNQLHGFRGWKGTGTGRVREWGWGFCRWVGETISRGRKKKTLAPWWTVWDAAWPDSWRQHRQQGSWSLTFQPKDGERWPVTPHWEGGTSWAFRLIGVEVGGQPLVCWHYFTILHHPLVSSLENIELLVPTIRGRLWWCLVVIV